VATILLSDGAQMANFWRFLGPAFSATRVLYISDLHSKFALGPHRLWNYTSNLRPLRLDEEKNRKKKKKETEQKYN